jgi:hypothetical protein
MPISAHSVSSDEFPFTLQAHDEETGELLWHLVVERPGAVTVPGFAPRKVTVTVIAKDQSATSVRSDHHERQHTEHHT